MEFMNNVTANVVAGIVVAILSYLAGQLWVFYTRMPWVLSRNKKFTLNLQGTRELEKLISSLAEISMWLGKQDIEILDNARKDLWRSAMRLQEERFVLLILHSKDSREKRTAFRELASINEERALSMAMFIANSSTESSLMKRLATDFIDKKEKLSS